MSESSHRYRFNFWHNSRGSAEGLQPELVSILPTVQRVFRDKTGNPAFSVVINAGQEWHNGHRLMSLHHTGYAIDFQTRLLPGGGLGPVAKAIATDLATTLGAQYRVELESSPPHLHIEFRTGTKMSNPGDFPAQPIA
jgi:hypothetical protein